MNKADLLEQLQNKLDASSEKSDYGYRMGLEESIELVEQLTCITDPTFPAVIKEPIPVRDYGVLYLVLDGENGMWYITRQDSVIDRSNSIKMIERLWTLALNEYYPETRETK